MSTYKPGDLVRVTRPRSLTHPIPQISNVGKIGYIESLGIQGDRIVFIDYTGAVTGASTFPHGSYEHCTSEAALEAFRRWKARAQQMQKDYLTIWYGSGVSKMRLVLET